MTFNKTEYQIKYAKEKLKRIPLDLKLEDYEKMKVHCEKQNIPVNTFIKNLIKQELEKGI